MPQPLIVVNDYELITTRPDRFAAVVAVLAARVKTEGHPGVRSYQFFIASDGSGARAVIRYDGPDAWIGHHEVSFGWREMRALHIVARLRRVSFHGPLTAAMQDWLARSPLDAEIVPLQPQRRRIRTRLNREGVIWEGLRTASTW